MPPLLADALQALSAWPVAVFLRSSTIGYASLNAAHIFALALVVGSIVSLDLRLLGLFRRFPVEAMATPLSRIAAWGVALAIGTGFLLFSVRPLAYAQNPAFLIKVGLVGLGVINALALRWQSGWRAALAGYPVRGAVRAAAALSMVVWAGAVLAGRWIGFLQ